MSLLASLAFAYFKLKDADSHASARDQDHTRSTGVRHSEITQDQLPKIIQRSLLGGAKAQRTFKGWVLTTSHPDIITRISDIQKAYQFDPDRQYNTLSKIFHEIGAENPVRALWILEHLSKFPKIEALQKEILGGWLERDQVAVFAHLTKPEGLETGNFVAVASDLFQNKYSHLFPQFLALGDSLKINQANADEFSKEARQWHHFVTQLAAKSQPDTQPQVAQFLSENSGNPSAFEAIVTLVPSLIKEDPQDTVSWLRSLNVEQEQRAVMFASAMQSLATDHGDIAATFLDRDSFLEKNFNWGSEEQSSQDKEAGEKAYDLVLQTFIFETMGNSPQLALENTELFFDPEYKEYMKEIIGRSIPNQSSPLE